MSGNPIDYGNVCPIKVEVVDAQNGVEILFGEGQGL
jgi:hypothetical protein